MTLVFWLWNPFHKHLAYTRRRWDFKASTITQHFCFSLSPKYYICLIHTVEIIMIFKGSVYCTMIQKLSAIYRSSAYLELLQQFFPLCTQQDCLRGVSHAVYFTGGMLFTFVESFQGPYKDGTNGTRDFGILTTFFFVFCIHSLKSSSSELQFVYFTGVSCFYQYEAVLYE